jgi:hypothetical protein
MNMKKMKAKQIIREFTQYIDPNITVKFNRKGDNASDMKRKIVYLDLKDITKNPHHTIGMKYHFKNEVGLVAYTLLHEIGHIETAHEVGDIDKALETYSLYVDKLINSELTYKHIAKNYSKLTLEKLANAWAHEFAKNEYDKVLKLKYDLLKLGLH